MQPGAAFIVPWCQACIAIAAPLKLLVEQRGDGRFDDRLDDRFDDRLDDRSANV